MKSKIGEVECPPFFVPQPQEPQMPKMNVCQCDKCDFRMPSGYGSNIYAVNDIGERVIFRHPGEHADVMRIKPLSIEKALA